MSIWNSKKRGKTGLGEHVERERIDAFLVDHDEAAVAVRRAERVLEVDDLADLVVGELALGGHELVALLRGLCPCESPFFFLLQSLSVFVERLPGRREPDTPAAALEKRQPQPVLHGVDMLHHRHRRHVLEKRGLCETSALCHAQKYPHLLTEHACLPGLLTHG